jgi:small subunit ribosomal protein S15
MDYQPLLGSAEANTTYLRCGPQSNEVGQRDDSLAAPPSAFTLPPPACYPHYCHNDKSKLEQECTRLVLAREQKKSVIDQYQTHATDTGSPEVQIAIISERIGQLTDHFKTHQKDHGSRRGLLMLVSKRRRLLDYLKRYDSERYKTVIGKLGIRK